MTDAMVSAMVELKQLLHPGPPPRGWTCMTIITVVGTAVFCIVLAATGWLLRRDPHKYFSEGKPGTMLSVGFFFVSAWVCGSHFRRTQRGAPLRSFWLGMSVILAIAALDDQFKLHERADVHINRMLGLNPKGKLADRIDDALVMAYALPAIVLAWLNRRELLRLRWMILTLGAAFICFAAMAALDVMHTRKTLEESLKLLAGAFIVCALVAGKAAEDVAVSPLAASES